MHIFTWLLLNPMSMSEDDWEKTSMNKMVHEDCSISQTLTPSQNESSLMTRQNKTLKGPLGWDRDLETQSNK